ncbi:hypothetical protein HK405_013923, partial [Cladochytrium tenue]
MRFPLSIETDRLMLRWPATRSSPTPDHDPAYNDNDNHDHDNAHDDAFALATAVEESRPELAVFMPWARRIPPPPPSPHPAPNDPGASDDAAAAATTETVLTTAAADPPSQPQSDNVRADAAGHRKRFVSVLADAHAGRDCQFLIFRKADGAFLGCTGIHRVPALPAGFDNPDEQP